MKKIFRRILLIILILVIPVTMHTVRNFMIIKDLQNASKDFSSFTSLSVKTSTTRTNGEKFNVETYLKEDKFVRILERITDSTTTKISEYYEGDSIITFIDTIDKKIVRTSPNNGLMPTESLFTFETGNAYETFITCLCTKIRTDEYNGKECYVMSNFMNSMMLTNQEKNELYFEKDTGLDVKHVTSDSILEKEYQFNNVKDSMFTKPNINLYTPEQVLQQ